MLAVLLLLPASAATDPPDPIHCIHYRARPTRGGCPPDTLHTLQGATHPRTKKKKNRAARKRSRTPFPPPHHPPTTRPRHKQKKTFACGAQPTRPLATRPRPVRDPPANRPRPTREPFFKKKLSPAARNDPQAIHSPPAHDPPATFFNLFSFAYGAQPTRSLATRRRPVRDPPVNRPQPSREPFCKKFLSPAARNDPPAIHSPLTTTRARY